MSDCDRPPVITGFIARLGGDEFTLVFTYSGDVAEVERRAEELVGGFQRPLLIDRREVSVGVSCGVAMFPGPRSRRRRRCCAPPTPRCSAPRNLAATGCACTTRRCSSQASNRFRVEQALRKAIDGGDFVLHYQPQVCLGRQRTTAVEALLRWRRSDNQIVAAGEFIEIAEQIGPDARPERLDPRDGGRSGAQVAARGLARRSRRDQRLGAAIRDRKFSRRHRALCWRRHGLPPDAIELELTETMLQTGAVTVEALHGLQLLNVDTALDDFGTGFSSLTSIERLPLEPR